MSEELLRVYLDPSEIGQDGYPYAWRGIRQQYEANGPPPEWIRGPAIKELIREQAGYRCERCRHPYPPGVTETCPRGEWTPCDEQCTHGGPLRADDQPVSAPSAGEAATVVAWLAERGNLPEGTQAEAQWRILTTHHLNGIKHDCRWWNLAALCQRCHLAIQGKVSMERIWPWEHSEWFKPHAAGWYAFAYLGEELTRTETMARLDSLLNLELDQNARYHGGWSIAAENETTRDQTVI